MVVRAATFVPSTLLQPEPPGGSGGEMAPFMAQALYTLPEAMSQVTGGIQRSGGLEKRNSAWSHDQHGSYGISGNPVFL